MRAPAAAPGPGPGSGPARLPSGVAAHGRSAVRWTAGYLKEVVSETSAHGCIHLTTPGRHTSERVAWFLILVGATVGAVSLCMSTYDRYRTSPVVVSLERNYIDWNFVLPAAFLCPDYFVDDGAVNETAKRLAKEGFAGGDEATLVSFLVALGNASGYSRLHALEPFSGRKDLPSSGLLDLVIEVRFPWMSRTSGLVPTVTEVGICYVHNSAIANWTSIYPEYRAKMAAGAQEQILSTSSLKKPIEYNYEGINAAFRGYVVAADALPSLVRPVTRSPRYSSSKVKTRARETYATDAARALSPGQRACHTENETPPGSPRPLYSAAGCREWCRARLAQRLCGCRPYFVNISGIAECNVDGMVCLSSHLETLRFLRNQTSGQRLDCGCLPACDDYTYEVLRSAVDNMSKDSIMPLPAAFGHQVMEMARVRFKRDVLFSIVDLCVSFGGAVGLCLGCSVLTLVELLYYLSIRVIVAFRNR